MSNKDFDDIFLESVWAKVRFAMVDKENKYNVAVYVTAECWHELLALTHMFSPLDTINETVFGYPVYIVSRHRAGHPKFAVRVDKVEKAND
ncbi:hypothetical protein vBAcoSR7M_5 [Alteromonas phage vB_AcoS-R7M]|uniref:Uncharacterized protein n=1 Tax=Alteromonas phage vB_AcoS-R7M TaxID=2729541 RepID=A0A6M3YNA8_9CAUD|nr:hypothetical protein HWD34_gp05 [Alteromonas phage vB_AcoS-R7M]QJI53327.1 hypothetical protein vBAcoSR7M_5 [Alteromonas phage vB_AcoS-R7M]